MSRITLAPNASGTGTLTVAAPNTNTDRTLTLPDATGTVNISGLANEVPAGSAGSPSIYSTGDSNTGVFFPAADTVAVTTGGSERMRVDSSGNVGIGTSSPSQKLDVRGAIYQQGSSAGVTYIQQSDGTNSAFWQLNPLNVSASFGVASGNAIPFIVGTNNTERMRIDSSGNVGIGTSSGLSKAYVTTTSSTAYGFISQTPVVGLTAGSFVNMAYFADTRAASNDGLRIVNVRDSAGSSSGNWETSSYRIRRSVDQADASSGVQEEIVFGNSLLAFNTGGSERMRIDSAGNLLFNSGYGSVATAYGCRAWVKFNSAGGVNGSGNVTSVTNNAVGSFTINFTTAMPDTNYAAVGSCGNTDVAGDEEIVFFPSTRIGTSTLGYRVSSGGGAAASVAVNFVTVFR